VRAYRDYTSVRAERDHIASAESLSIRADWIRHGASRDHATGCTPAPPMQASQKAGKFNLEEEILLVSDAEPNAKVTHHRDHRVSRFDARQRQAIHAAAD